jgi:superfamily I DNA/RNA helicase
MIFGAPGCGKTTYLIQLLDKVLRENEPDRVAFVSFTKKGSYEGRDRAMEVFDFREKDLPYFRTMHSIAFRELGMSKWNMVSRRHYKEFSSAMGMHFLGYYTEDLINNDDRYLLYVSLKKNNPRKAVEMTKTIDFFKATFVDTNYEKYKKEIGIKDFDDLMIDFIREDKPLPVDVAIVDEAQDLTPLQWKFCEVAFRDCKKVYAAGDDDQAIYEWSGADVGVFLNIKSQWATSVVVLDKSYRLKENILEYAKNISGRITERVEKVFESVSGGGEIVFYNNVEEISVNSEESYYFLSRNRMYLGLHRKFLMNMGAMFTYKGESSVDLGRYQAIRKYEHLRRDRPGLECKDQDIIPYLKKDYQKGLPWYDTFEMTIEDSLYHRDLFKNKTDVTVNKITVSSIHGVKGGEADNVVLYLGVTRKVHENFTSSIEALNSELRCLYVGITRAKKKVHIVYPNNKYGYDELLNQ